jgi:uncharacterized membrane protein YkoI
MTLLLLGAVAAIVYLARGNSSPQLATAASLRPISGPEATKVAKDMEKLHNRASSESNDEDAKPIAKAAALASQPVIPPEQAISIVQKSVPNGSQVSSVTLTTGAGGQQIYNVGTGDPNGPTYQVDAVTGQILTQISAAH